MFDTFSIPIAEAKVLNTIVASYLARRARITEISIAYAQTRSRRLHAIIFQTTNEQQGSRHHNSPL